MLVAGAAGDRLLGVSRAGRLATVGIAAFVVSLPLGAIGYLGAALPAWVTLASYVVAICLAFVAAPALIVAALVLASRDARRG